VTNGGDGSAWTLLTGHGHVLVAIAKNPQARIRDLSGVAGLTERATQAIIADLEEAGYITRHRKGRRTSYTVHPDKAFRHQSQEGLLVGPFLELLAQAVGSGERSPDTAEIAEVADAAVRTPTPTPRAPGLAR
jgi:DNA-binding MarR family transcriptional regulator